MPVVPAHAPATTGVLIAPVALPALSAAAVAPAATRDEAFKVEGCVRAPLLFWEPWMMKINKDRRAGYSFRFARGTPPTWLAKDVGVQARSPMAYGCPFVVRHGNGQITQRPEVARDNTVMDLLLLELALVFPLNSKG